MAVYHIEGGKQLAGSISVTAGKNSPVALLCATLLLRGTVVFREMTHVEEVERILEILQSIGVRIQWQDTHTLLVDTSGQLDMIAIDRHACEVTRSSLLLIGALAARQKEFTLYKSGGCKLGNRTVRPHTYALEKLGVFVESTEEGYVVTASELRGAYVVMYESGDTATENAIMAAVLAPGTTQIKMASANYMVQDLCHFLVAAGADIKGIGTTTLHITGVGELHSVEEYTPIPDPVDAMAWISLAVTTHSELTIKNCPLDFLELELEKLHVMGQECVYQNQRLSENNRFALVDITLKPSDLRALPDKLYGRPFPGLNIDNVPLFVPFLTQAAGTTLVHDWCYENRAVYYLELKKLGARVLLLDPHRVLIEGPVEMKGNDVVAPPALRPAMALLIAMIAARGESTLRDVYQVERGYEQLVERLRAVGVAIERSET